MSADEVMDVGPEVEEIIDDPEVEREVLLARSEILGKVQDLTDRAGFKGVDLLTAVASLIEERNRLKFEMGETRAKIAVRLAEDAADKALRPFVADLAAEVEAAVTQKDPLLSAFLFGRVDGADRLLFAFERRWTETAAVRTQESFDLVCLDRLNRAVASKEVVAAEVTESVTISSTYVSSGAPALYPVEPPTPPAPLDVKVTFSQPTRRYLPDTRASVTRKITLRHANRDGKIEELDIYVSVGLYDDGTPGEIFLKAAKAGDTISGFLDALGVCVSIGLQYGAPLASYVAKLRGMRFEPNGTVLNLPSNTDSMNSAGSIVDAVARWIENRFLILPEADSKDPT